MISVPAVFSTILLVCGVLVLAITLWVLGLGARAWAEAIDALHKARAHGVQADVEAAVLKQASEAAEDAHEATVARSRPPYQPPTEKDLRASLLAQRAAEDDREYTTHGNEGVPD